MSRAPIKPSDALLKQFRSHRANLPGFTNLYPYAIGWLSGTLEAPDLTPAAKVKKALEIISALDIVEAEPRPEPTMRCPECGVGQPGHGMKCSRAPVATLGPRS